MTSRTRSNPSFAVADGTRLDVTVVDRRDVVSGVPIVGAGGDAVPVVEHPANGIVPTSTAMATARHDML
ncbi:MAG: hypothetical protein H0U86_11160 [Chloroflexi bacterium]|nr:hypothetical protein [Chloroflexota bacterium]